jgi:glutamine synthetase
MPDWRSLIWLPGQVVMSREKPLLFANVFDRDGQPYEADARGLLAQHERVLAEAQRQFLTAVELEAFLLDGDQADVNFEGNVGGHDFTPAATGSGYFGSGFTTTFRLFIDAFATVLRSVGFAMEKDHAEVAPGQVELNFKFANALLTADRVMLYRMIGRELARHFGCTLTFLPKPFEGVNGSGMHTTVNFTQDGENEFPGDGQFGMSEFALQAMGRILETAPALSMIYNSSVNSYRRLAAGASCEAPNRVFASACDRGAMIRIPHFANPKAARFEVRVPAPDGNPYLLFYAMAKAMDDRSLGAGKLITDPTEAVTLPGSLSDAVDSFERSAWIQKTLPTKLREGLIHWKRAVAERSPRDLGSRIKRSEVWFHHLLVTQETWQRH